LARECYQLEISLEFNEGALYLAGEPVQRNPTPERAKAEVDRPATRKFNVCMIEFDIVRGSGGVRKIIWAAKGKGKSSGIRVMYYWKKISRGNLAAYALLQE